MEPGKWLPDAVQVAAVVESNSVVEPAFTGSHPK